MSKIIISLYLIVGTLDLCMIFYDIHRERYFWAAFFLFFSVYFYYQAYKMIKDGQKGSDDLRT